ncbi:SHD1 domain-containing protein [Pirellulaceae bacterium SH467]|jgi:hypothetical protein
MPPLSIRPLRFCSSSLSTALLSVALLAPMSIAQSNSMREWSDSTGTYKIQASLIEVKDGIAFLKTNDGKTLKIPLTRLSEADQAFLKVGSNPFEEVAGAAGPSMSGSGSSANANGSTSQGGANGSGGALAGWASDLKIDWNDVDDLDLNNDGSWNLTLPPPSDFGATAKRAMLKEKENFHEDLRRLDVNPTAMRAVAGFTVSFSVPKPLSRLSLIDFATGKAIHTAAVEADMGPLCLLNDGSTVLMQGSSDDRKGFETPDQLQLWKVTGKQVTRSSLWVPFPDESESFGRKSNAKLSDAIPLANNKLLLVGSNGHVACIDVLTRKPYWHARLTSNFAVAASLDRSLVALVKGHTVLIVDPDSGQVKCQQTMTDQPHLAWTRACWNPSGNKLIITFTNSLRVLDLTTGEWAQKLTLTGTPIATNSLSCPHDDYALLDGRLLLHIPSQIKVCEYRDAKRIEVLGGMSFIAMQSKESGLVVPAKIPHPAAEKILAQAENDPSVFLIHPGVEVSIDASGAGQYAQQAAASLKKAAEASGYKVVDGAPISLVATISGPKQEAVSYIASGSFVANVFQSGIRIKWQGKDVWSTGGSNIPGILETKRGESIQQKLDELGRTPNLHVFEAARFPKLLQRPSADAKSPVGGDALMVSKFTMQGLVDSN